MDNSLEPAKKSIADGEPNWPYLDFKIEARRRLNSLPPHQAQAIVNKVLGADELKPDLSQEIDWDEIPQPSSWKNHEQQEVS
ncbi:MAG: hypothetical protein AAF298_24480 [Cyanobacteria bacterium P01_A01_bin.40]